MKTFRVILNKSVYMEAAIEVKASTEVEAKVVAARIVKDGDFDEVDSEMYAESAVLIAVAPV